MKLPSIDYLHKKKKKCNLSTVFSGVVTVGERPHLGVEPPRAASYCNLSHVSALSFIPFLYLHLRPGVPLPMHHLTLQDVMQWQRVSG